MGIVALENGDVLKVVSKFGSVEVLRMLSTVNGLDEKRDDFEASEGDTDLPTGALVRSFVASLAPILSRGTRSDWRPHYETSRLAPHSLDVPVTALRIALHASEPFAGTNSVRTLQIAEHEVLAARRRTPSYEPISIRIAKVGFWSQSATS